MKTGISHRYLRPSQAIVDPSAGRDDARRGVCVGRAGRRLPRGGVVLVAAVLVAPGARRRPTTVRPTRARTRWPTCGPRRRWSTAGGICVARWLGTTWRRAGAMMLAATMAGVGFGSAGVHIPHACAYPIAGLKHAYEPPGYPTDHPFVPHGISVIVTAPAAFRFTYSGFAGAPRAGRVAAGLDGDGAATRCRTPCVADDRSRRAHAFASWATTSPTSRSWSRARSPSSACSSGRRASVRRRPRVDPAREFAQLSHNRCCSVAAGGEIIRRVPLQTRHSAARRGTRRTRGSPRSPPRQHALITIWQLLRDRPRHERGGEAGRARHAAPPLPRRLRRSGSRPSRRKASGSPPSSPPGRAPR